MSVSVTRRDGVRVGERIKRVRGGNDKKVVGERERDEGNAQT